MKPLCILLNLALVAMIVFMLFDHGMPDADDSDFWFVILVILTPAITLYYLIFGTKSESWLQLYFRRKAAEERKKLQELESNDKP